MTYQAHGWAAGGRPDRMPTMSEPRPPKHPRPIVGRYVAAMGALGTAKAHIADLTGQNRRLKRWGVALAIALAASIAMHVWGAIR